MKAVPLPGMFERYVETIPTDPRVPAEARPRLSRQERAILARLEQGPATNRELADIALKYTSRISVIRQAGYDIQVVERNVVTGFTRYALKGLR